MAKEKGEKAKSGDSGLAVVVCAAWALLLLMHFWPTAAPMRDNAASLSNLGGGGYIGGGVTGQLLGFCIAALIFWPGMASAL